MMEEGEAKQWLVDQLDVSRETLGKLEDFLALLIAENERQNLISRGSIASAWSRHIVDSAQLLVHAPDPEASWLDLGTGAGFPGLVVGLLHHGHVTLVEERRLRVEWLRRAADALGIAERITILCSKVERLDPTPFDIISARAFAPMERLLQLGHGFSTTKTRWILPKGRNAASELEAARASWQGEFRLEPSLTDADASIIVAEGVVPKAGKTRKGAR